MPKLLDEQVRALHPYMFIILHLANHTTHIMYLCSVTIFACNVIHVCIECSYRPPEEQPLSFMMRCAVQSPTARRHWHHKSPAKAKEMGVTVHGLRLHLHSPTPGSRRISLRSVWLCAFMCVEEDAYVVDAIILHHRLRFRDHMQAEKEKEEHGATMRISCCL